MWTKLRMSSLLSVGCLGLSLCGWSLAEDPLQQLQPQQILPQQQAEAPAKRVKAKDLHARYPFVDVRSRLNYEARRAAPAILSAEADQRLTASESELARRLEVRPRIDDGWRDEDKWSDETRARLRRHTLSAVHSHHEDDFIQADGFGISRIGPALKTRYLEMPTPGSLPFAKADRPGRVIPGVVATPADVNDDNPFRIPSRARLAEWHAQGEIDFLNVGGLGIKTTEVGLRVGDKEDKRVAGFESHRFRRMPEFVDQGPLKLTKAGPKAEQLQQDVLTIDEVEELDEKNGLAKAANRGPHEKWLIERLELVSLLKHETPAVYVSKELPAMEALGKVPTRQPSPFETQAIAKLRGGEDLVVESRADTVRMVGAIRARQQCLECHQTERGTLLGAFSYDLARELAKAGK